MSQQEPPAKILDPAASDGLSESARNGAEERRDPDQPSAVVGLGASAGGVSVLQEFFEGMLPESGLAFVVVMHLSPDHESNLAAVLQQKTSMPVIQVTRPEKLRPNRVYVIPPNRQLIIEDSTLDLVEAQQAPGRRVTIDLFFRTLAQSYGQRSVCVILSGSDSDGVIGLKHIRAQGGVTMAQDPDEAEHDIMPATAISTGMVDWVLPVAQMPAKLLEFVRNEARMQLPPEVPGATEPDAKVEDAPGGETVSEETREPEDELALHEVLVQLRSQTGHDFTHYKRATILRRVARRLQVNSLETIPQYLEFMRRHPAEARALFQDLLIGVTHFFRDQASFAALEANVPQLFAGKKREDQIRVWVPGCATGEEAYSIAMLLCEYAERLEAPPSIQVFATDIDESAVHEARDGLFPSTIEADVSLERLRRFFSKDQGRYRVKKDLRERVLFAAHNLLVDPPFSRLDLISCRNLLIYLNAKAQEQVFDILHFALRRGGLLFLGNSETSDPGLALFTALDPKHRVFVRRSVARPAWTVPMLPIRAPMPKTRFPASARPRTLGRLQRPAVEEAATSTAESNYAGQERRSVLFGELHLKLLEQYGPPSVVVNEAHDIVHLSENAGRYLHFVAGEPTANLLKIVHPSLRLELRTALFRAAQANEIVSAPAQRVELAGGAEMIDLQVRPLSQADEGSGFFLVVFKKEEGPVAPPMETDRAATERDLDGEMQFLKEQLNRTVEQYETANEELKASNEEQQAINEELRSATEELETSKEELQSVNEELSTVNHELKSSVEELSSANADLNNLMASTDIGTIFLDRELRVKRFTPSAQTVFNILPSDLNRPLSDITNKLAYPNFTQDARKVLEELQTIEREVRLGEESWFLSRIAPYRTADDHIAGIVVTFIDVTRRKQAERESRAGERRYRTLFDLVPAAVYSTDAEGVIQEFNRQAVELWGRTPEKGEKFCGSFKIFYPNGAPMLHDECPMARVLQGENLTPSDCEIIVENDDGSRKNVSVAPSALKNERGQITGAINCLYDITARKRSEEALRSSEERFRLLVEGARDYAMFLLDPENVITFWSAGADRVFGWTQEEATGQSGAMIFTAEDRNKGEVEKEINGALTDGRALDRRFHLRKDGSRFWTDGVLMRLDDESGKLRGFAKVARDATDQRRIEDELLHARDEMEQRVVERTRELLATNNELEQTMAQRQQLERELLEISEREKRRIGEDLHDMVCQELTATALYLKSSAKKLAKENPAASANLEEAAQTVNRNVVLARELAGGLQAVELTASGLKNALRDLAARASENAGIKCHFKAARGVRVPDDTVALHLYRIAQEAVANAVKHSGAKNILISLDRNPTHTCVTVQDDGQGFVVKKRGKGLGLHMMRYRANALGGELRIERRRTGGMEITCVIPTKKT